MCVRSCKCTCVRAQLLMLVRECVFHCSKRNANYWASGSVKCTAVVTVSARWTIELVYKLTEGQCQLSFQEAQDGTVLPTSISGLILKHNGFKLNLPFCA